MTIQLARRMDEIRASEIRELLKLTDRPGVISFAGGLPAAELFPINEMIEVDKDVLGKEGCQALQYSATEGHLPLREIIAGRMNDKMGTSVAVSEILITSGSQQGLDLTGKLFLDEGDVVLCESPTYIGAIQAFRAYQPRFVEVPTDDDGMIIDELENRLLTIKKIKFIYVIPDFQNPTGRTWSRERRLALLDLANRYQVPVIEDAPYSELRFAGEPIPPLKALDDTGIVIFLGTFSKIFCPGLRIGWLAAGSDLHAKFVLAKQGVDLHTASLSQRQIRAYVQRFSIDDNIQKIRDVYFRRRNVMLETMDTHFPPGVRYTRPHGGLFLWAELPECVNARELLQLCLDRDVAFVPGGSFSPNGGHENTMRLNYSAMPEDRIEEGIKRIASALRHMQGEGNVLDNARHLRAQAV